MSITHAAIPLKLNNRTTAYEQVIDAAAGGAMTGVAPVIAAAPAATVLSGTQYFWGDPADLTGPNNTPRIKPLTDGGLFQFNISDNYEVVGVELRSDGHTDWAISIVTEDMYPAPPVVARNEVTWLRASSFPVAPVNEYVMANEVLHLSNKQYLKVSVTAPIGLFRVCFKVRSFDE